MASLVSAGVSVTVTDESFFIPAAAATVPLIFIATADEKTQPDGTSQAAGTYEYNVVRTVTSLKQSVQLYGVPRFLTDSNGSAHHGDARNEYGLMALNQFLSVGNMAYVVRANVNLDDSITSIRTLWNSTLTDASSLLESLVAAYISEYNTTNGYISSSSNYKVAVTRTELLSLVDTAMTDVWAKFSFKNCETDFMTNATSSPLAVYSNGYSSAAVGTGYVGFEGLAAAWETDSLGSALATGWTAAEASNMLLNAADSYKFTISFLNKTSLGSNDANRRLAIVTALASVINSNEDVRAESYEYNLILCPGFPELANEMVNLSTDIGDEAFVIADTPFDKDPDAVVTWASTTFRQHSTNIAYYYPHGIRTNLDGNTVFVAASGIALVTIANNDDQAYLWFPPAGTRRGSVTTVTDVGYVSGTLGTATTFVPVALNQGQRDNMYKYYTNLNPIVYFPDRGIIVWGQKTSPSAASAMDRVNVVRLIMYIRRKLRKNTMPFVFEPNDKLTRDSLKAMVDSFLSDLVTKRGLYDFATVCDESNNTATRIDNNELYVDIALKPVRAAEFIYIPIRVVATSASLTS